MKLVLHATEPATRQSAAAQLIEYDLAAAAELIEHDLVELIARIEALRVPAATRETKLSVGSLELDLIERTAKRSDRSIDLLPREFRLLEYMMRREGRVLTREMLFREVWKYKFDPKTNLVDVHMGRLRRKIDGPDEPPMILNVRGKGFIFRIEDKREAAAFVFSEVI
jgi:two-component system OmpR family response regulator